MWDRKTAGQESGPYQTQSKQVEGKLLVLGLNFSKEGREEYRKRKSDV